MDFWLFFTVFLYPSLENSPSFFYYFIYLVVFFFSVSYKEVFFFSSFPRFCKIRNKMREANEEKVKIVFEGGYFLIGPIQERKFSSPILFTLLSSEFSRFPFVLLLLFSLKSWRNSRVVLFSGPTLVSLLAI